MSAIIACHGFLSVSREARFEAACFSKEEQPSKCYFPDYRFSEDLDFTLAEEVPFETIRKDLDVAFEESHRDSGVLLRYARSDRQPHANVWVASRRCRGLINVAASGNQAEWR